MSGLQISKMKKQYKVDPSFAMFVEELTIHRGELFVLLGPSGCGKTTLLKLIAGLVEPDQGEIYLDQNQMTHIPAQKRGFGMVFQQSLLFPHMTVEENVAFGLKMMGMPKKKRIKKARTFLARTGLSNFDQRYPHELSGGQQQRVSFVRSLVLQPSLLLMDEPFSALDPTLRSDMQQWLKKMCRETGVTMILVTHDRSEAYILADRVGVMNHGRLLQVDQPEQLYRKPRTLEVARLMGLKNTIRGEIKQKKFISDDESIQFHWGEDDDQCGSVLIPPHAVEIVGCSDDHQLQATVMKHYFLQGTYHITLLSGSIELEVIKPFSELIAMEPGERVGLKWDSANLHFIKDAELNEKEGLYA